MVLNIPPPKPPRKALFARHEYKDKSVRSSDRVEMEQGKKMENKSEPVSIPTSREILKTEEFNALHS